MKSFKNYIVEQTLEEATAEELYDKYYSDIHKEIFNELWRSDPSAKNSIFGNYSKWILSIYKKMKPGEQKRFIDEDLYKVNDALKLYDKAKKLNKVDKKDINQFKSLTELIEYLDSKNLGDLEDVKSKGEIEKELKEKGAKKVFENSDWTIIVPETHDAACFYGAGTQWCTASKGSDHFFRRYSQEGPLFIIISKKEKDSNGRAVKYQFHFESNQFMDSRDHSVANRGDVEKFMEDEFGEDVVEFFDKEGYFTGLTHLINKHGYDSKEVKDAVDEICDRKYGELTVDGVSGKYVIYDHNSNIKYMIGEMPYKIGENVEEARKFILEYYMTEAMFNDLKDSTSREILHNITGQTVSNMPKQYDKPLAKKVRVDLDKPGEEMSNLYDDMIYALMDDKDYIDALEKYYYGEDGQKYFTDITSKIYSAVQGTASKSGYSGDGDDSIYLDLTVAYKSKEGWKTLEDDSPPDIIVDEVDICLYMPKYSHSTIDFLAADENDDFHTYEDDDYYADELRELRTPFVDEEKFAEVIAKNVIEPYLGINVKDPRQMELDLQSFQKWMKDNEVL